MVNTKKGFTLIELLVVIAIIGILSSVVLASLNTARKKSRDARRVADVKQIQIALEVYFVDNGTYPETMAALTPEFIPVIPNDPLGDLYLYSPLETGTPARCNDYHLRTVLEDVHPALATDADRAAGTICTGYTTATADAASLADDTDFQYNLHP